jgi:hypothetical protein
VQLLFRRHQLGQAMFMDVAQAAFMVCLLPGKMRDVSLSVHLRREK